MDLELCCFVKSRWAVRFHPSASLSCAQKRNGKQRRVAKKKHIINIRKEQKRPRQSATGALVWITLWRDEKEHVWHKRARMHGMETGYPIDKGCLKRRPRAETVESSLRIMKCSRSTMRSTLPGHCFPWLSTPPWPRPRYTIMVWGGRQIHSKFHKTSQTLQTRLRL